MTQYSRGADFERKVKADLQANGYFVVRAAGSHGPVDLTAQAPGPIVVWVQCKRDGKMSLVDRRALVQLSYAFHATPILAFKDDDGDIKYSELDGDGYLDWHPGEDGITFYGYRRGEA
jgi:Holliday junction resolvase